MEEEEELGGGGGRQRAVLGARAETIYNLTILVYYTAVSVSASNS